MFETFPAVFAIRKTGPRNGMSCTSLKRLEASFEQSSDMGVAGM